jgi:deoxycytidine triphosphate deaminase
MILSGQEIKKFNLILGAEDNQYQPHGIDLRLDRVFYPIKKPYGMKIREEDYEEFPIGTMEIGEYFIPQGSAILFKILETIDLTPKRELYQSSFRSFVGFIYPKSSLSRRGIFVHSAVWDSGYKGSGYLLVRTTEVPLVIHPGDAFCQMVFSEGSPADNHYHGQYQGENTK